MRTARSHITIIRDSPNEGTDLFNINWSLHGCYSFNFFLDHGLRPVGVSQYPSQSVSFTAHSHLDGFIGKPFCSQRVLMMLKFILMILDVFHLPFQHI